MKLPKVLCILLCLILCITLVSCDKEDKIMENYPQLIDKKHIIKEITPKEVIDKVLNEETFILVLGFPACPWCQALLPEVNSVGKELKIKTIYYCDIKDCRDNENSIDKEYYLQMRKYFSDCIDSQKDRINAPTTLKIKDGQLVSYHVDTVSSHMINEAGILPTLTSEQIDELHEILKELFNK